MKSDPQSTEYLTKLQTVCEQDIQGLSTAQKSYGNSWKKRGGVGAYMMLARKIDRIELQLEKFGYDVFKAVIEDPRKESLWDDLTDLRRYLLLIEAELQAIGFKGSQRDNLQAQSEQK